MTRMLTVSVTLAAVVVAARPSSSVALDSAPPNIVLIIADDMNWNDCGAYGHPRIRTPNIDRLAANGMRFNHAYLTASSCSPSRSSIITGKYPHNTGAEQLHWPLPAGTHTFVKQLRRAGYHATAAGKWHLGDSVKDHFDVVFEASTAGFQLPSGDTNTPPRMIAKEPSGCERWLEALRKRPHNKPFFLWLAALDPQREYVDGALDPPHQINDVIVPKHLPDRPQVREDLRMYYDEIGRLDSYVGTVVDELQRQDVAENTVIIFMSDNGRPFPRDKTTLYDGGIRTPLIVVWPKRIQGGSISKSLISVVDLAPTIAEIAGLPPEPSYEGKSIVPILHDGTSTVRDFAFAEDHWHDYEEHARAIVNQRFKLIRNDYPDLPDTPSADAGRSPTWQVMRQLKDQGKLTRAQLACFRAPRPKYELYDLIQDPGELNNVADADRYAETLAQLVSELNKWAALTDDWLPSKRTPDEFDRTTGEPDHSVRIRPRPSKLQMFGTNGKY